MIHHNHEQGSEAWLACRAGVITASRFKDAREKLKGGQPSSKATGYAAQVALERIAGRPVDKFFETWQMREGKEQEGLARIAYEAQTGNLVHEVGFFTTEDRRFGYSPDGMSGEDGLIEIKTILSGDAALKVLGQNDLSAYMDQCLGGLWLTGRKWIDLAIWCPALATINKELTIHRVTRDEAAIEALEEDLLTFLALVNDYETTLRLKAA